MSKIDCRRFLCLPHHSTCSLSFALACSFVPFKCLFGNPVSSGYANRASVFSAACLSFSFLCEGVARALNPYLARTFFFTLLCHTTGKTSHSQNESARFRRVFFFSRTNAVSCQII